jgi:hypothetical protein
MMMNNNVQGQSQHRDCLHVLITLVFHPGEQADHFEVKGGIYGKKLAAYRFNTWIGKRARDTTYDVPPESKAWLFKSEWPDLFYAVSRDSYFGRLACTCEQPYCSHVVTVRSHISSTEIVVNTNSRRTYDQRSGNVNHRRSKPG